ncbi:hypothetical protein H4W33_003988 [Kibdelosporangium phytohabitans]|nr:hypothetical protein [Kibdelosporangium phytohabitans]
MAICTSSAERGAGTAPPTRQTNRNPNHETQQQPRKAISETTTAQRKPRQPISVPLAKPASAQLPASPNGQRANAKSKHRAANQTQGAAQYKLSPRQLACRRQGFMACARAQRFHGPGSRTTHKFKGITEHVPRQRPTDRGPQRCTAGAECQLTTAHPSTDQDHPDRPRAQAQNRPRAARKLWRAPQPGNWARRKSAACAQAQKGTSGCPCPEASPRRGKSSFREKDPRRHPKSKRSRRQTESKPQNEKQAKPNRQKLVPPCTAKQSERSQPWSERQ